MKILNAGLPQTTRRGFFLTASGLMSTALPAVSKAQFVLPLAPTAPFLETNLTRTITASYFAPDGTLYYVGEDGSGSSVHQSADGGQTWKTLTTFANQSFESRCFTANALGHLFFSPWGWGADTSYRGLWRSTDNGKTWARVLDLSAFPNLSGIWGITSLPNGTMYAGVYNFETANNANIFRSLDFGATWTSVYYNPAVFNIHDVAADPFTGYVYATLGYATAPGNTTSVVRSTNGGATWSQILPGLPQIVPICVTPFCRLFGSADSTVTGIYRTADDKTFSLVLSEESLFAFWLRRDPITGWVYAGFTTNSQPGAAELAKIYVSKNDGQNWALHSLWPSVTSFDGTQFASNIYNGKMAINLIGAGVEENGVLVSTQNPVGYVTRQIAASHLGVDGKLTFAGVDGDHTSVFQSGDQGVTWSAIATFPGQFVSRCFGANLLNDLFLSPWGGTAAQSIQGLYISRDNGRSWSRVLDLSGSQFPYATGIWGLASFWDGSMYAGVYSEDPAAKECYIYKSSNYGTTWTVAYQNPAARHVHDVQVDPFFGHVYASFGDSIAPWNANGIVRSTDSGRTWTTILPSLPQIAAICVTGTCRLFGADDPKLSGIWRTTDDNTVTLVLPEAGLYCFWIRQDPLTLSIYAGFVSNPNSDPNTAPPVPAEGKIYVSKNDGQTWTLHSIWPAVRAYDGPNYASNIWLGKMAVNVQYNGGELNGALISTF